MTPKRNRLTIVASHPIQHFCPLYRKLAATVDLLVVFKNLGGASREGYFDPDFGQRITWGSDLLNGYNYVCLHDDERALSPILSQFSPDVVQVYGLASSLNLRTWRWSLIHRRRLFYISDSQLLEEVTLIHKLRRQLILPLLFRTVTRFLVVGDNNRGFYKRYRIPDRKLSWCPFPIDSDDLDTAKLNRSQNRQLLLTRFNIPSDAIICLTVGKLIPKKRIQDAIVAVSSLPHNLNVHLVICGEGPDRPALQEIASANPHIHFAGFVNVDSLPVYFSGSDILIHPAKDDPHPLVVGEAVYSGIPVILSDSIGCVGAHDDAQPGRNCVVYPTGDVGSLRDSLSELVRDSSLWARMAEGSRVIGSGRSLTACAAYYLEALDKG